MSCPVVWCVLSACVAALGLVPGFLAPAPAHGGFQILDESAAVDRARRTVTFRLTFSQPPDLLGVDEFGRVANSFQYEINPDFQFPDPGHPDPLARIRAVVRGDEVRFTGGNLLRIRNAGIGEIDPDPAAGGWGKVRAAVPFDLDGSTLSFTANFDDLKDTDGVLAYRVFSTEFGQTTTLVESALIPLPPAAWAAGLTLAAVTLCQGHRARRSRLGTRRAPRRTP